MMSVPEAAKTLGLAPATVRAQIRNGKMKAKKLARDWFITEAEVERYRVQNRRGVR